MKKYFFLVIPFLIAASIQAKEDECLSGESNQSNLVLQFRAAKVKSKVTQTISEQYNLDTNSLANTEAAGCTICGNPPAQSTANAQELGQVADSVNQIPAAPKMIFKAACLNESNDFDANTQEVSCPSGNRSKSRDLCLTSEIMNYQNAAISSFLNCFSKSNIPTVSPGTLFEMYSLESGFKPQYAYNGGVGIGQLTGVFVKDVHQPWRGGSYLKKIAQSDLKECQAAKIVAQKDLANAPHLNLSNSCDFIQLGEGFERNILYTLTGMATAWEKDLEPLLKKYFEKHKNDPLLDQVKNLTTVNSYGPGGRAAARTLAQRLSVFPPAEYIKQIQKPILFKSTKKTSKGKIRTRQSSLNVYNVRMKKRQDKIKNELPENLKTEFETKGAKACINH